MARRLIGFTNENWLQRCIHLLGFSIVGKLIKSSAIELWSDGRPVAALYAPFRFYHTRKTWEDGLERLVRSNLLPRKNNCSAGLRLVSYLMKED